MQHYTLEQIHTIFTTGDKSAAMKELVEKDHDDFDIRMKLGYLAQIGEMLNPSDHIGHHIPFTKCFCLEKEVIVCAHSERDVETQTHTTADGKTFDCAFGKTYLKYVKKCHDGECGETIYTPYLKTVKLMDKKYWLKLDVDKLSAKIPLEYIIEWCSERFESFQLELTTKSSSNKLCVTHNAFAYTRKYGSEEEVKIAKSGIKFQWGTHTWKYYYDVGICETLRWLNLSTSRDNSVQFREVWKLFSDYRYVTWGELTSDPSNKKLFVIPMNKKEYFLHSVAAPCVSRNMIKECEEYLVFYQERGGISVVGKGYNISVNK